MNNIQRHDIFTRCTKVKILVQQIADIKDIGINSRQRDIADLKKIYCYICHSHYNAPLTVIASALRPGYHHTSVINSIYKFNELNLKDNHIYINVMNAIDLLIKDDPIDDYSVIVNNYTIFLDWYRQSVDNDKNIPSAFYVGQYLTLK